MVFCTSSPVLQTKTVLNGDHDLPVWLQMLSDNLQEIHIRILALDIGLSIFKYTDQSNIIVFLCQFLLHILKISHKNLQLLTVSVSPRIDLTALHGQIDTSHFTCSAKKGTCNSTASGTDLQHLFLACKRHPAKDILSDM